MLRRAVVDYVLYSEHSNPKMHRIGEDAATWIFSTSTGDDSFEFLCVSMNLDPVLVRDKICSLTSDYVRTLRGLDFEDG